MCPNGSSGVQNEAGRCFRVAEKGRHARGCIGTIGPVRVNLAEEIIYNAISAGTQDPRFPAVRASELKDLVYFRDVWAHLKGSIP
jgi:AMMECR1 domain-containing protein